MNYSYDITLLTRIFPQSSRRSFFFFFYGLDVKPDGYAAKVNVRDLRSFPPFVGFKASAGWLIPSTNQSEGSPFRDVTLIWAFSLYVLLGTFPKAFDTSTFPKAATRLSELHLHALCNSHIKQSLKKKRYFSFCILVRVLDRNVVNNTQKKKRKEKLCKNWELFSLFTTCV